MPFPSCLLLVLKRVFVRSQSCENMFHLQQHFHKKGSHKTGLKTEAEGNLGSGLFAEFNIAICEIKVLCEQALEAKKRIKIFFSGLFLIYLGFGNIVADFHVYSTRRLNNRKYILLDVLLCSIAEYFYELCRILASS